MFPFQTEFGATETRMNLTTNKTHYIIIHLSVSQILSSSSSYESVHCRTLIKFFELQKPLILNHGKKGPGKKGSGKKGPEKRASGKKGPGKKGSGKKGLKTSKNDHFPKWLEIMKI